MKRNDPSLGLDIDEPTPPSDVRKGPDLFTPVRQPGMPVGQRLERSTGNIPSVRPSTVPVADDGDMEDDSFAGNLLNPRDRSETVSTESEDRTASADLFEEKVPSSMSESTVEPGSGSSPPASAHFSATYFSDMSANQSGEPVIDPEIFKGLSEAEIEKQIRLDQVNHPFVAPTRTIKQIIRHNVVNTFNILNFVLAGLVVIASISDLKLLINLTFMGVVLSNIVIGTFQEIRAKHTIDKLAILTEPHVKVVRGEKEQTISVHELVIGDLMILEPGNQISVDATFVAGQGFEVDESLLTGESDTIVKRTGDDLLSGSVVMAGTGCAIVENVGTRTFAARISMEAKREVKKTSQIMDSLNKIIKILTLVMIPVGAALFISSYNKASEGSLPTVLVSVVAALIGMIPEGLMLLTSVAFAVGVIKLGQRNLLVQTLPSIETLARVDTICLDKTGTLTNGRMEVSGLHIYDPQETGVFHETVDCVVPRENKVDDRLSRRIATMVQAQRSGNATQDAMREYFATPSADVVTKVIPFSSKRKWSGVQFATGEIMVMGAPEFIMRNRFSQVSVSVNQLASKGYRVLLIATATEPFLDEARLPNSIQAVACVSLVDQLRENVNETLSYFYEQGVSVKIISGDNPRTVAAVARSAGMRQSDKWIDMSQVEEGTDLSHLVETYTLFGRVTPFQKRQLLNALQDNGHVVSMTGDGVNDVLALKEADCSVAMADGSDAARAASDLVLLDNNIASMVDAVYEGRRVINNVERVATLFLVKTVYSCFLSFIYIFLPFVYPLVPIQNSLISGLTIGLPSFVLALKPNKERVRGNFLRNVMARSLSGGLAAAIMVVISQFCGYLLNLSYVQCSTVAVLILSFIGLMMLRRVSQPMDAIRRVLFWGCSICLIGATLFLPRLFFLSDIISPLLWFYVPFLFATNWLFSSFSSYGRIRAEKARQRKASRSDRRIVKQRKKAKRNVLRRYRPKRKSS